MNGKPTRYARILDEISRIRARVLLEVGTWNGDRAIEMLEAAYMIRGSAVYYGFDLFEMMTARKSTEEFNVKAPSTVLAVEERLSHWKRAHPGASFEIYPGDTRETLPGFAAHNLVGVDLAWIDGGHSIETIASDWLSCSKVVRSGGVILLDDYYTGIPGEFTKKFGSNTLVDSLAGAELLPEKDPVKGGGFVQIAKVVMP